MPAPCTSDSVHGTGLNQIMEKKKFVLRIDEQTMKALEKWAADEFRSLNGQLEYILTQALRDAGRHPRAKEEKK